MHGGERLKTAACIGWGLHFSFAASVDVDRIAVEMDFQALQHNIMNVTFCNIHSEVAFIITKNSLLCHSSLIFPLDAGFSQC